MSRSVAETEAGYVCVVASDELWDGEMAAFAVDGEDVLLIRLDGEYHAYDGDCPHQSTPLVDGELQGTTLVCRAHEWSFDARTGNGINPAAARLRRHQVRVADGCVWVRRS
jgi:toluene monooxygenase system ferredoxin subunit